MAFSSIIRICLLLSIFTGFEAKAQYDNLDQKYGFRDLRFGMLLESIIGLTEVNSSDPLVTVYVRHTDIMKIGAYPIQEIQYRFYKNKLYSISVDVTGSSYIKSGVREVLISEYGLGKGDSESMTWRGKRVHMSYSYRPELVDAAFLFITDLLLESQHFAEQLTLVKKVPSGL